MRGRGWDGKRVVDEMQASTVNLELTLGKLFKQLLKNAILNRMSSQIYNFTHFVICILFFLIAGKTSEGSAYTMVQTLDTPNVWLKRLKYVK